MIAGIDLGTTNSLVGTMDSGFPVLIAGSDGQRLTPSAVAFLEDGRVVVGAQAFSVGGHLVTSVKRLMGARVGEQPPAPYQTGAHGEPLRLDVGGRIVTPVEISALILAKLKGDAEAATGSVVDRAVITVPAYFNDAQRQATKQAGEQAGFVVERLVPEPTAAALAFGLDKLAARARVAVYDLGGGTFDISVLDLHEGVFHVLATHGDTRLGGDDLDKAIAEALGISKSEAKHLKQSLEPGSPEEARIRQLCEPIIARTRALCQRALLDAGVEPSSFDEILVVGGATRMPLVRDFVAEIFGRAPNTSQHPDEAVAMGATIQAGVLDGAVHNVTLLDVTPLSLGIETYGGLMNVLIPRNTTLPAKAGEMFTNASSGQTAMRVTVLQGERELAADNWTLGEFCLEFPSLPRGQSRVGIQFEIDADGILHVLARDVASGKDTILDLSSAVEVSDEAVEKMLADSLEHAFEDMDDRQFAEAKIKADEMLPAVESALAQVEVPAPELAEIRAAENAVRSALDERSLQKLKKALCRLDESTQSLAAKLVEQVLAKR